jgi:hypothetical protein
MSKRIGTAIRCEEQRTSYLNQEYAKLIAILQQHGVEANDPCRGFFYWNIIYFLLLISTKVNRIQSDEEKVKEREEKDKTKAKIYLTMAEQSVLAKTLKQIYNEYEDYLND